jgi:hypothetical protein
MDSEADVYWSLTTYFSMMHGGGFSRESTVLGLVREIDRDCAIAQELRRRLGVEGDLGGSAGDLLDALELKILEPIGLALDMEPGARAREIRDLMRVSNHTYRSRWRKLCQRAGLGFPSRVRPEELIDVLKGEIE